MALMKELGNLRTRIRAAHEADEHALLDDLIRAQAVLPAQREHMERMAVDMIETIRRSGDTGLMEQFLGEYGLSTHEGLCLMTLAEAFLRVPDQQTVSALIEDKIGGGVWSEHLGQSDSRLVNFSTRALVLTRSVLDANGSDMNNSALEGDELRRGIRSAVKRLGEPFIRRAVRQAMVELGKQFVLGETVDEALSRGMKLHRMGYRYSYDMLGEAALTADDAQVYLQAYQHAIQTLASVSTSDDCRENPGISVKLSALHPRYEYMHRERVMSELVPRVAMLAKLAARANMGFNIDAEEANRLDLSLDIVQAVLDNDELAGWDGFGVVVQAYGKRCSAVLEWLHALASQLDRKIMVRLVKGAYWDTEIKQAQVLGLEVFPVFTQKAATDVAYLCCARQMLHMHDTIYSQFATHNAHTVAGVLELAKAQGLSHAQFEFQRLHGMGAALHDVVRKQYGTRCRIYAPVGSHRQLLAYLVRRLLENGANSSFVNQLSDPSVPAQNIARDPFGIVQQQRASADNSPIVLPMHLYGEQRINSRGLDTANISHMQSFMAARKPYENSQWHATPLIATGLPVPVTDNSTVIVHNPSDRHDIVGTVRFADAADAECALTSAVPWNNSTAAERHDILVEASFVLEAAAGEWYALLAREAGKSAMDAIAELREAVDFMRYYGEQASREQAVPRGVFACISPWNFPLAIFLGQVSAALAAGNAVICKPADSTALVAYRAVQILHAAGVPASALQLLPGLGADIGRILTSDARINGVCFTGSTAVAHQISVTMAQSLAPDAVLIAETGGLNAMIIDSTALPEQAIRDVVASAFQSAGQRCSALRILCVQQDIADEFQAMLFGAMDELQVGNAWRMDTDVGPIINDEAHSRINHYIDAARRAGRVLKQSKMNEQSEQHDLHIAPTVIGIARLGDVTTEVFGPVLHVLTYRADELPTLLEDINNCAYGLTFGLHTRIESRVDSIINTLHVGNMYVNRNQIGAVVGSQPFGGEGLSGTGPKAGGPHYLRRYTALERVQLDEVADALPVEISLLQEAIDALSVSPLPLDTLELPGPTGESNTLRRYARGIVVCLGPSRQRALQQAQTAQAMGCAVAVVTPLDNDSEGDTAADMIIAPNDSVAILDGQLIDTQLAALRGIDVVVFEGSDRRLREYRMALACLQGPLIPLVCSLDDMAERCVLERHVCIDTTAAGGNATLLAAY